MGFRSGLIAGAVTMAAVGVRVTFFPPYGEAADPASIASVRVDGRRISDLGGAKLVLRSGYDTITMSCRDLCDDLRVDDSEALYGGYSVRLLDEAGSCLFCRWTDRRSARGWSAWSTAKGAVTMTTNDRAG